MNRRTRTTAALLTLTLALVSACGNDETNVDTTVEGSASDETDAARGGSAADDEPATSRACPPPD